MPETRKRRALKELLLLSRTRSKTHKAKI